MTAVAGRNMTVKRPRCSVRTGPYTGGTGLANHMVRMSHRLDPQQPAYPRSPRLRVIQHDRISNGDAANSRIVHLPTHFGTHVDLPAHFFEGGESMTAFDLDDFNYVAITLVDVKVPPSNLIIPESLSIAAGGAGPATDLVLLRSGFEAHRGDRLAYEHHGPALSAEAAEWLVTCFPMMRAVAIDWLSLCSPIHFAEGVDAHRTLLGRDRSVVFEDVKMSALNARMPTRISAFPLLIEGLDGSPVTMIGELDG